MIFRCICGNCQTIPTEEESIYFQEVMQVVAKLDDSNGGSQSDVYQGLRERTYACRECQAEKVEDVTHWLLECNAWCTEYQPLLQAMRHIANE